MDAVLPARARSLTPFGRVVAAVASMLCLSGASASAAVQQAPRDLPATGEWTEQSIASGAVDEWLVHMAAPEFVAISIEPQARGQLDEWPAVTVTTPDGLTAFESAEPSIVSGVDGNERTVVSLVAERSGIYRLHINARRGPLRYRLRVNDLRPVVDADQRRIQAHQLWREAMRGFTNGSQDSLRASIETLERALSVLTEIEDAEGQAITLGTMGAVCYQRSDAVRGQEVTKRAIDIWRQLGREREEALAISDLGLLVYLKYDHATARTLYEEALAKHRAVGDLHSEARTLVRLGWVQFADAELQQVIETDQRTLPMFRSVGDPNGESVALNDLGRAYLDLGEVSLALDALQQALALRPPDRYPQGAANVLMRIGLLYTWVAEWQRGLDTLQQALALARKSHDVRTEITALVNLGSVYMTFGDTSEGFRYLEPALASARTIEFRGAEANALLWLGVGSALAAEPARSRDYLQQALAIQASINDVRGQARSMRQLAAVQLDLGTARDALASIKRSIEISPAASGMAYNGSLTLANVYAALGDDANAQAQYEEALARFRGIRARDAESGVLMRYGRFRVRQGRYAEARDLLEQSLAIHESLRGLLVDPDLRMTYGSMSTGPYRLYVDVLMELERAAPQAGFAEQAFHANERARARGLVEMLATSGVDIHEGVDQALIDRERSLRWDLNRKAAIQTTLLVDRRDETRLAALEKEIADLSRKWRETTTMIRQQSPAYWSLTQPEPVTLAGAQSLLDAETVLLAFVPGETRTWLFAVTPSGCETFPLSSNETIDAAARDVHHLLTARQPQANESAAARQSRLARADAELAERSRTLSDLLLAPVADRLDSEWRGRRLAIVGSGALEYVPFAALPSPRGASASRDTRLVASHEIVRLPSASSLAILRRGERPAASKTIAVVADPVFGADDPRVTRASAPSSTAGTGSTGAGSRVWATRALEPFLADTTRASLARLPFSRAEALAVSSQVPRSSVLQATDFDASLALATSGRLSDYRIIHFATHGLINTMRPELSGLALSLVDRNGRSQDGFLRLNTIYNLRLAADLVVLSACQTALGKEVAGEGLVGLTRGFMYAGARRVIASLWQVSDVATAELMKKFYTAMLQQHLPPAAALRRAQLEMARDPRWASPFFWAGFVLQGDWQQ
ncbi:MAG TPA: CHAT domain-containing protein [Vicinamibacterales bacterium]